MQNSLIELCITVDDLPAHGPAFADLSRRDIAGLFVETFARHGLTSVVGFANGGLTDSVHLTKVLRSANRRLVHRILRVLALANIIDPQAYLSGQFPETATSHVDILKDWVAAGHVLGNHTYWHSNLNNTSAGLFIKGIEKNEKLIDELSGKRHRIFRYPFLKEGGTRAARDEIRQYLKSRDYLVAPVTVDFADWAWNRCYVRSVGKRSAQALQGVQDKYLEMAVLALKASILASRQMFGRDIPQVLLLHMGAFTALTLEKLLHRYSQLGVTYVTMDRVMADDAYRVPPDIVLPGRGRGFLEQLRIERNQDHCLINRTVYEHDLFQGA